MAQTRYDNDSLETNKPSDNRYGIYTSTTAASLSVKAPQRTIGLTVGIRIGLSAVIDYWWESGLEDNDLVIKVSPGRTDVDFVANSVTLTADGTDAMHAVSKQQLDAVAGGGVTDHGALTGLSDDDHTQYHTNAKHTQHLSLIHISEPTRPY